MTNKVVAVSNFTGTQTFTEGFLSACIINMGEYPVNVYISGSSFSVPPKTSFKFDFNGKPYESMVLAAVEKQAQPEDTVEVILIY